MRGDLEIVVDNRLLVQTNCSNLHLTTERVINYTAGDGYLVESDNVSVTIRRLEQSACVVKYEMFPVHKRHLRGQVCADPYLMYQDYIFDTNIDMAWTLKGPHETSVIIVDDGIGSHRDIVVAERFPVSLAYFGDHSNSVASVAAGESNNVGLCGANGDSRVVDINLLANDFISDLSESMAFEGIHYEYNAVYCNSWGPTDDGRCEGTGHMFATTLRTKIATGRQGLGCIYVFAAGNGGSDENVNDDGYANNPYTLAVAASHNRDPASFSEWGACIAVTAPGYQLLAAGPDDRFKYFYGTSAAAPIIAGIVTILLSINPNLYWYDVHEIVMVSTKIISTGWSYNAAERRYHYALGSGMADANRAARLAETWIPTTRRANVSQTIEGGRRPLPVLAAFDMQEGVVVEQVVVCVSLHGNSSSGASVGAWVQSPFGTRAILTRPTTRVSLIAGCVYRDWCFTSLTQRGEEGRGRWIFFAESSEGESVVFQSLRLDLLGSTEPFSPYGCVE